MFDGSGENLGELSYEFWVGKDSPSLSLKPEIIKADGYDYFRKKALQKYWQFTKLKIV